ncbi:MAG: alpha/beta hydrolase [Tahibacter sp.]
MLDVSNPKLVPTLVCLHGAGGGGWEWNIWRRVFAASGWRVLAPDLQPRESGVAATRIGDYCAQVVSYCEPIAASDLVIAGASLGGLLALQEASRRAPAGLILLNPIPPVPIVAALPARPSSPPVVRWSDSSLASTLAALPDADAAACWYAWRRWRDESGAVIDGARHGVTLNLPSCPSLLFASSEDSDIPPASTRALADALRGICIDVEMASHVGVLLGGNAAVLAAKARDWAQRVLVAVHAAQPALNVAARQRR